jgi:hypothetical protein
VGKHRHHGREKAERDMARDIGAAQAQHRSGNEAKETEDERGDQGGSHEVNSRVRIRADNHDHRIDRS